jgi:hypothetical protein
MKKKNKVKNATFHLGARKMTRGSCGTTVVLRGKINSSDHVPVGIGHLMRLTDKISGNLEPPAPRFEGASSGRS